MTKENLWSRRAFVKSALAAAAGSVIVGINKGAYHADVGPLHNPHGSSLTKLSLSEAPQLVPSKKVSPVELTQECLSYIERLNPRPNAFMTVTADSALA